MLIKAVAIFITVALCFQRIFLAVGSIAWGLSIAISLYLIFKQYKQGELKRLDEEYKKHYKAIGICFFSMLPGILISGNIPHSVAMFSEMWLYYVFPIIFAPLIIKNSKMLKKILLVFGVSFMIDCLVAGYQMYLNFGHVASGVKGHHNFLGSITAILTPLLCVVCLDKRFTKKERIFAFAMLVCTIIGNIATASRAAWVCVIIVVPLVCIYYIIQDKKKLLCSLLVVVAVGGFFVSSEKFSQRLSSTSNVTTNMSNLERIHMWNTCMYMIKDHPFGVGLGQFKEVYDRDYQPIYATPRSTIRMPHVHNIYIQIFVEGGIIGFLGFMYMSLYILWRSFYDWIKTKDAYSLMIFGGWLTFLLYGIFDYIVDFSSTTKMWWFILGALLVFRQEERRG